MTGGQCLTLSHAMQVELPEKTLSDKHSDMEWSEDRLQNEVRELIDQYRDRCLWFLRADYYPDSLEETLRTLDYIDRYGDTQAYQKAGEIRKWLLRNIKNQSADC